MLDLQAADPGQGRVIGLHPGDDAAPLVAQATGLVQIGVMPLGHEAAIPRQQRRLGHQRIIQQVNQRLMPDQIARRIAQHGRRITGQAHRDGRALRQPRPDRGQIARPAPVQRQPRQRPVHVRHPRQRAAQIRKQPRIPRQRRHRVMARRDQRQIARRRADPAFQQARARRGHGAVDGRQQRSVAPARQGLGQLQIAPGRGVDLHRAARAFAHRRAHQRQAALLRHVQIIDDGAHRGQFGAGEAAEAVQRLDPIQRTQPPRARIAVEGAGMQVGHHRARIADQLLQPGVAGQNLARGQPRQFGGQTRQGAIHHRKRAGRDVDPSQRALLADHHEGRQVIVPPRLQQRFLGQGARRHQPHHVARHDRFRPALLGLGGVLHLFGNGHAETLADQRQQIALGRMDRHAAHRDGFTRMGAAFRQRDVQRGGGGDRVVEEHLVEIAHAIEQQRAGIGLPDRKILRHHRRGLIRHVLGHGRFLSACAGARNLYIQGHLGVPHAG